LPHLSQVIISLKFINPSPLSSTNTYHDIQTTERDFGHIMMFSTANDHGRFIKHHVSSKTSGGQFLDIMVPTANDLLDDLGGSLFYGKQLSSILASWFQRQMFF
jgi:hypothetical protein